MFIGGVKEAQDKIHGPPRLGDRAMLKAWREHGAPGGLASDPLSGHECGDSRYLAIAFFDACLAQRLPDAGSSTQTLKPVDMSLAWLAAPDSNTAQPASEFTGDKAAAHWLPDAAFAKAWSSYNQTGRPADTTPPPAPTNVRLSAAGELTWSAEADLESGLGGFIIERDGKELARLPEKPVGKLGTPLFQGLTGGDTPVIATPPMRFKDTTAMPGREAPVRRPQRERGRIALTAGRCSRGFEAMSCFLHRRVARAADSRDHSHSRMNRHRVPALLLAAFFGAFVPASLSRCRGCGQT